MAESNNSNSPILHQKRKKPWLFDSLHVNLKFNNIIFCHLSADKSMDPLFRNTIKTGIYFFFCIFFIITQDIL